MHTIQAADFLLFFCVCAAKIKLYLVLLQAFCSVLKRDVAMNFKAKGNALVSVLACNVLMAAFLNEDNWPDNYVKVRYD